MKKMTARVKSYLSRPEAGAGLLFVALAFAILWLWITRFVVSGQDAASAVSAAFAAESPRRLFYTWTLLSLAVSAWLAFLLLRRRLGRRAMQRVLLVAAVHAAGAIRFYEWGMMLLSVLPLFAIMPRVLLAPSRDER